MKYIVFSGVLLTLGYLCKESMENKQATSESVTVEAEQKANYTLVIHGGAGTISKETVDADTEKAITEALNQALDIGQNILKSGGSSLDAVENVIRFLEDSPHFNAGKGAVFTHEGHHELDASIMDGRTLQAGAVGGVRNIKNPISLARTVLHESPHVLLTGKGAEAFAEQHGFQRVDSSYFYTERRWKSLQRALEREKENQDVGEVSADQADFKFGTVGAAALDQNGHLAAATSTGGMTNKRFGRIGDSPIIGAGTYADNSTCAVSCTGHGEYFIRKAVAHDLHARIKYSKASLEKAAEEIIHGELKDMGGSGGLIAVDKDGNITMPFNTAGMYRGYITPDDKVVKLYAEQD